MDLVRKFLFDKACSARAPSSADAVGIEFADKSMLGDKANVKLRFDTDLHGARGRRQALSD